MNNAMIGPCACMGPQYGEPYCPCVMKLRGLPLNEVARAEAHAKFKKDMQELFGPGGRYSAAEAPNGEGA